MRIINVHIGSHEAVKRLSFLQAWLLKKLINNFFPPSRPFPFIILNSILRFIAKLCVTWFL